MRSRFAGFPWLRTEGDGYGLKGDDYGLKGDDYGLKGKFFLLLFFMDFK